jgi:cytochrome P450
VFHVESQRIYEASGGNGFLLGMQDDAGCPFSRMSDKSHAPTVPGYRDYQALVMKHFALEDLERVRQVLKRHANAQARRGHTLDAASKLITGATIAVCREYYGIDVSDEDDFANCTFAISRWYFDPQLHTRYAQLGAAQSKRLDAMIDVAIARARRERRDTVVDRLLQVALPEPKIRAILSGMIVGFVPTSTMAASHMLQVLLTNAEARTAARVAARANDDLRLERCLFEALRFKPLVREPLRVCKQPFTFAEGTRHAFRVKPGERVLGVMGSALMDERRIGDPQRFNPDRPLYESFLLGSGLHRCIGAPIATLHAVETLKPLLLGNELREVPDSYGREPMCRPFVKHLFVQI